MDEREYDNIKIFVRDFLHDAVLYFTGGPLNNQHENQFMINFNKKFDEYLLRGGDIKDVYAVIKSLLRGVDINIAGDWKYICRWCGKDHSYFQTMDTPKFCDNKNCAGFIARGLLREKGLE